MLKSKQAERLIRSLDRLIAKSIDEGRKLSYSAIARDLGENPQFLTDIKSGKKDVDLEFIQRVCKKLDVSQEFILNGDGHPLEKKATGVPVYNVDFTAGDVTLFQDDQTTIVGYVDLEGFRMCKGFARVRGSSMYPEFTAGDFIGLEPDEDLSIIDYGMPYGIVTKTNKRLFKLIRKGKDDDHLILRSINKDYDDINIHKSQILKLFKVHGPLRDQWQ